ncbi:MAG: hypothetical protein V1844_09955 [Pseudomonadota bacterium]
MPEIKYRFTMANIPISIIQGATYYQRWQIRYGATRLPFPFFSDSGVALWKGRCMFRSAYSDTEPKLSLTTEGGGVILDLVTAPDGSQSVYYALYATAAQTSVLPAPKVFYDIEFERLTDGWVIRPQKGMATVDPEVTK